MTETGDDTETSFSD